MIITIVGRNLGDVPAHITVSAADSVLETLKGDMKDFDKKKDIEDVLGITVNSKEFNELVKEYVVVVVSFLSISCTAFNRRI